MGPICGPWSRCDPHLQVISAGAGRVIAAGNVRWGLGNGTIAERCGHISIGGMADTPEDQPEEDLAEKARRNAKSGLLEQVFEAAANVGTGIAKLLS